MQRHRCTKCRNPIRSLAVARQGDDADDWFHPDCWAEVCISEQADYERQVETDGVQALLAPYLSTHPVTVALPPPPRVAGSIEQTHY